MPTEFKILTAPIVSNTKAVISNTVSNTISKVSSNTGITFGSVPIISSPSISFSSKGISGLSSTGITSNLSLSGISSKLGGSSGVGAISSTLGKATSGLGAISSATSGLTSGITGATSALTSQLNLSGISATIKADLSGIASKIPKWPSMDMIGIALGAEKEQLLKIAQAKLVVPPWVPGLKINLGMIAGALKIIKEISSINPSELLKQITDAIKEDIAGEISDLKDSTGLADIQNQVKDAVSQITDAQKTVQEAITSTKDGLTSAISTSTNLPIEIQSKIDMAKQSSSNLLNSAAIIPPKG